MANREVFSVEGIGAMISELDKIEREVDQKIDRVLIKLAQKVITDAKKLAPLDSGDLEAALIVGEVRNMLKSKFIDFGTSPEVDDYAMVQHEGFRKTKTGKVVYMSPGPKTDSKGAYKGYMPGKKYLENAIKINEKLIIEELTAALRF
ncbi:HK97 gp10 family phage protein [Metabacillus bambusae]|uniref:HK97 gp10 family phage protein n=1 Tax=Metabacillus bambusae TaxID=2795218 RepID=A0ABS3N9Y9_9BACI|nr:HK97 gp10 family phage protein [Metabacillus bambusae]MBO1515052.1 HK97 gp10 family phage protein [Metabacillus bambusae]